MKAKLLKWHIDKRQFLSVFIGADNRREKDDVVKDGKMQLKKEMLQLHGLLIFFLYLLLQRAELIQKDISGLSCRDVN